MPYVSFHSRFPEIGVHEYRVVKPLLDGVVLDELMFTEQYCDEPGCDCRRVLVHVSSLRQHQAGMDPFVADLAFGWEDEAFYRAWAGYPLKDFELRDLKGPAVRMLAQQTERSNEMLEYFELLLSDPAYVARIQRHYGMFRTAVAAQSVPGSGPSPRNRKERRRARRTGRSRVQVG